MPYLYVKYKSMRAICQT